MNIVSAIVNPFGFGYTSFIVLGMMGLFFIFNVRTRRD